MLRRSRISFIVVLVSLCFFLVPLFLQTGIEEVPINPEVPELTILSDRSLVSIYFYILVPMGLFMYIAFLYFMWNENVPKYRKHKYKDPRGMVILGGIVVVTFLFVPMYLFPEFLTEGQDVIIIVLMTLSAILLFISGIIYKKTET